MIQHKNIHISGIVQGVGFRYSARTAAKMFRIKGFTRNLPDGTVYIEAEAPEYNMNKFLQWCNTGPSHARVDNVQISDGEVKNFKSFDIVL